MKTRLERLHLPLDGSGAVFNHFVRGCKPGNVRVAGICAIVYIDRASTTELMRQITVAAGHSRSKSFARSTLIVICDVKPVVLSWKYLFCSLLIQFGNGPGVNLQVMDGKSWMT